VKIMVIIDIKTRRSEEYNVILVLVIGPKDSGFMRLLNNYFKIKKFQSLISPWIFMIET